jgi:hypothetical protein
LLRFRAHEVTAFAKHHEAAFLELG